ncbi:MAG TPA: triple tyrosine motif-containing protein [Chryseosolibacter sp.]
MRSIVVAFFVFSATVAFGQTGNYFLSHFSPSEERFDYICFDMAQDGKGIMYFATKAGIMEFDGRDWDLLQGPSAIYAVKINSNNQMYWAGAKGFGKIGVNARGFQEIQPLSKPEVINAFQIVIVGEHIYFLTEELIYVLNEKSGQIDAIKPATRGDSFSKLFELFGTVYVNATSGLFKIDGPELSPSKLAFNEEVVFFSRIDNSYVLGTSTNRLYSCDENLQFRQIKIQDQAYIDASVIVSGSWFNRQLLALGTLRGGVIFINPINGLTQEITNYSTGLPDNEVFQLMTDVNQNVWVAHDYGFTRIAPFMPLRSFSHYEGLEGNILCTYSASSSPYVGTSVGLFRLDRIDVYDELVYYVDVEVKSAPEKKKAKAGVAVTQPSSEPVVQEAKPADSKKGGLFSFLRKKKKEETAKPDAEPKRELSQPSQEQFEEVEESAPPKYRRERRTQKTLRAAHHVFRKVQGIDSKITHIAEVNGRIMASGLSGLYEVNGLTSRPILEEPIRYMFAPSGKDFILISNYNDEVRSLRFVGNYPENSSVFNNLSDQIQFIFENGKDELWFCGIDKIYRAEMTGSDVRPKQAIELNQATTDKTIGVVINSDVVLTNTTGFFKLNRANSTFEKIDSLEQPSQYFEHLGGLVYRNRHGWNFLSKDKADPNFQLLNIFHDIRFVSTDRSNASNLWLVNGDNELFKFFGDKIEPFTKDFPLILKRIVNHDQKVIQPHEINMDQEHSSVLFTIVQPDYINPAGVEFRFRLRGMSDVWSEWSNNNNQIPFNFLPTGDYTLEAQSKNIFGKITDLEPIVFKVLPPYWKRSWFYALEFSIIASLVILSFRLNTRYRIISRLLSLLTIILLIEFIQTAIGATIATENSPVIEFIVQVVVALLVLPVEGYLRNLMLRSLDSSGKFYQFIVPKGASKEKPEKFIKETSDID